VAVSIGAQGLMKMRKPTPIMTSPWKNPNLSNFSKSKQQDFTSL